ncbi:MAG: CoA transferase, partial [Chloroflexi bacterium]|nr:CoA transferase [Chloroflexota bacterium]
AGMMASEGISEQGLPRPVLSTPPADLAAGHAMATAVSAALYHRERTGRGQRIETTLFANALMLQVLAITNLEARPSPGQKYLKEELANRRKSGQSFEEIAREYHQRRVSSIYRIYYQPYRTKDWLIMPAALSESLQKKMIGVLGLHDPRFDPGQDPTVPAPFEQDTRLIEQVEKVFRTKTTAEWLAIYDKAGVPAGTVNFAEEMVDSAHAKENGLIINQEHPVFGKISTVGPILRMSETQPEAGRSAPALGQHTDEIMKELGYSQSEVAALRAIGILGRH